ncbi:hypothetical protein Ade02nite_20610 [Paractinoplanes deccanensis]|uniref:Uncharacterized protein n=1 Tax=Paractinoplanes deccanensis TaxID=113561 RepID=A0ABQ3Y0B1_9ACTN|nr:hypothetical protein [Actinoplanes deccanensis]GID73420.1 hypothetical protein Ade02nite_20610 [Actinoplanes deccanensis]
MTVTDPCPAPATQPTQDPDDLIAATLPYLSSAYYTEAAEYLASKGYTPEQIRALAAERLAA